MSQQGQDDLLVLMLYSVVVPPVLPPRLRYAVVRCKTHRIFYVEDDRFAPPCAKYGGHEPTPPRKGGT